MAQIALHHVMVVKPEVLLQCRFHLGRIRKVRGPGELGNASIKTLDHPVGLRVAQRDQAVFDGQPGADLIERLFPGRLPLAVGGETVREFLAVVGQNDADVDRAVLMNPFEKRGGGAGAFVINCLDPCDHKLYQFGKLHRARQVLSSLLSDRGRFHEHTQ